MDYKVIGQNQVEVTRDGERNGVIRKHSGEWQYGTFNGEEYPQHWIVVESAPFADMIGISDVIPKVKSFLE